jgi:hypothetical protein
MITGAERETLRTHLERTGALALAAIDRLSEAQWEFRPAPDAWSVGEVAEHIAIAEATVLARVGAMLSQAPEPERAAEVAGKDRFVLERVPVRRHKATAPEVMRPAGRPTTPAQVTAAISAARERTLRFVASTEADLRGFFEPHPALQVLDAFQWLLLIASHTERHVRQIEEWKQSPEYPHA